MISLFVISMSVRSQGAANQSIRASSNERCAEIARMAITEARFRIRARANQDGDPAFEALRGLGSPTLDMGFGELPQATADLERFPNFSSAGVQIEVLRRGALALEAEERVSYDAAGVIRFTCRVDGPRGGRSTQVIEHGFRQVLTGPARPFDMFTFCLLDPSGLLQDQAHDGDANLTIAWALDRLQGLKKFMTEFAKALEEAADKAQQKIDSLPSITPGLDAAKRAVQQMRALAADYRAATQPPKWPQTDWQLSSSSASDPGMVHLFHPDLVVYTFEDTVDLGKLNLPSRIGPLVREAEGVDGEIQAKSKELEAALKAASGNPSALSAVETRARALLPPIEKATAEWDRILQAYWDFQGDLVELGGAKAAEVRKRFRRFDPAELRRRAHFVFEEAGAAARAEAFLQGGDLPQPSGVVWVADPDPQASLRIDLSGYTGRLVVATSGNMQVDNVRVRSPADDAVTLIAHGKLSLFSEGSQVAAVSAGREYRGPGGNFAGSLILRTLAAGESDLVMKGEISRHPALLTGDGANGAAERPAPYPHATEVHLGPAPVYRREDR